LFDVLF